MKSLFLPLLISLVWATGAPLLAAPSPIIEPSVTVTASSPVYSVAISPNGKFVAAGAYGEVLVWSSKGDLLQTLRFTDALPGVWVRAVAFSPDGAKVVAIGVDDSIRVWETETGKPLFKFPDHQKGALCVAFSPDGATLATGGNDKLVKLWDAQTGEKLSDLRIHAFPVRKLCFSADGKVLISLASSGTEDERAEFARWDLTDAKNAALKFNTGADFYCDRFGYLGDGGDIAAGRSGRFKGGRAEGATQFGVWRTSTGDQVWEHMELGTVVDFALSGNGRLLFGSGRVWDSNRENAFGGGWVWKAETSQEVARLKMDRGFNLFAKRPAAYPIYPIAASSSGHMVAIASDRRVYMWFLK